jgi:hypothetical protein
MTVENRREQVQLFGAIGDCALQYFDIKLQKSGDYEK